MDRRRLVAAITTCVVALSVIGATCGGDDEPPPPTTTTPSTATVSTTPSTTDLPATTTTLPPGVTTTTTVPSTADTTSTKNGVWSDPTVWTAGHVPTATESVLINHDVTLDTDAHARGVTVTGSLIYQRDKTVQLESSRNVVVLGSLVMRPLTAAVDHLLRFVDVDEEAFVGSGMDVLDSDVGLWVMGDGQLAAVGARRTGWTRALTTINAGTSILDLEPAPVGWQTDDEIIVAPTAKPGTPDGHWDAFSGGKLLAGDGGTWTVDPEIAHTHPKVDGKWTAEVADLTRNVRIEGTPDGRSHIFIRSQHAQTIDYVGIRYMGPRKQTGDYTTAVTGRYGLHFHMSGDGSIGSTVTGTVVRDTGAHAFVPHLSNGITFTDTVAYNTYDDAYWWDGAPDTRTPASASNDIVIDHALAARILTDPPYRGYRLAGFTLGNGFRDTIKNSAAVGVQGNKNASGFHWPEGAGGGDPIVQDRNDVNGGVWNFPAGNIAHNNKVAGIFVWQNVSPDPPHIVDGFVGYRNAEYGIYHGAYSNNYDFRLVTLFDNGVAALHLSAAARDTDEGKGQFWQQVRFDGGSNSCIESRDHNAAGISPVWGTRFINPVFRNCPYGIHFEDTGEGQRNQPQQYDLIDPDFGTVTPFQFDPPSSPGVGVTPHLVRVQNGDTAYQVTATDPGGGTFVPEWNAWRKTIPPFAP